MNSWLIGLGESVKDRIELAFAPRELGVESIPFNLRSTLSICRFYIADR
jgi:biotin synthase-like enzyme